MQLNKKNILKILAISFASILFFCLLQNYKAALTVLKTLFKIITPFIIGGCLAFILNVPMSFFEEKMFVGKKKSKREFNKKVKRTLCMILSFIIVFGILTTFFTMAVVEIKDSVISIAKELPTYMSNITSTVKGWFDRFNVSLKLFERFNINWSKISERILDAFKNSGTNVIDATIGVTSNVFTAVVSLIIGFVFSIYILFSKEKLGRQFKKLIYSFAKKEKADKFFEISSLSSDIFSKFIVGQCCEALILGVLCYIGMLIFKMPYAAMISSIIGITALIPVFGAFIGIIFGAVMILLVSPIKSLWFIIFIIILQQIEGNVIYPKVVGKSVGLPGIWVLLAVTIGGGLFGALGLLVSVPLCSVLYCLIREFVNSRQKKLESENPDSESPVDDTKEKDE